MFEVYLQLGYDHINDIKAYDHILFIVALCAVFSLTEWRKILILVTAFTIGHSLTLALAALNWISISADLVETLIPITIILTALFNVVQTKEAQNKRLWLHYFVALFFGLIHGLGFSNYFRALLGEMESIVYPLLAFNIGVELGQLIIVGCILIVNFVVLHLLKVQQREWNLFVSGAAAGIALMLLLEKTV